MASDTSISITLRAKNAMAAGIADAQQSIKRFQTGVSAITSKLLGPIAGLTAAFMAVRKATKAWSEVLNMEQVGAETNKVKTLQETLAKLEKDYRKLTEAIKERQSATKAANDAIDFEIKSNRALADAQRELAKQRALAALDPMDKEGRAAVEMQFDIAASAKDAAVKVNDLRREQERLAAESAQKALEAAKLGDAYKQQTQQAKDAAKAAGDIARAASGRATTTNVLFDIEGEGGERAKQAMETARKLQDVRAQTLKDQRAALDESARLEKQAAELAKQIKAAEIAVNADAVKSASQVEIEQAQQKADKLKEIESQRKDQLKELAEAEKQIAAEIKAREVADLQEKLQAAQQFEQQRKAIADKRVADVIAEAKAVKEAAKVDDAETKKGRRLEDMERRGFAMSKSQKEFLDAFKKREAAQNDAGGAAGDLLEINRLIKVAQEGQAQTLTDLLAEQKRINTKLQELIPLG